MKYKRIIFTFVFFLFFTLKPASLFSDEEKTEKPEEKPVQETKESLQNKEIRQTIEFYEKKKKELESREKKLAEREEKLNILKGSLDERFEKLKILDKKIKQALANLKKEKDLHEQNIIMREEKKFKDLAKVYENMKAKKAAQIVNTMDLDVARKMFSYMRPQVAGKILANTNPDKAAAISKALTAKEVLMKK
ncbi:MAG: hypothetical protein CSB21_03055 [Deltaproteobacteria bacterium]|nr:MAG: hypothetical protein CSB21_03055 [Deltaproteobacteria bacterium]